MSDAIKEALKELGRVIVLAIVPILIDSISQNKVDLRVIAVTAVLAGLRFIDKYLHELAPEGKAGGIGF